MFRFFCLCVFFELLCSCVFAQTGSAMQKFSDSRQLLGTTLNVDVCYFPEQLPRVKDAVSQVWERMSEINVRMNPFDEKSDISRINRAKGHFVKVNEDVVELLQRSVGYKFQTNGAFDITVSPLTDLWRRSVIKGHVPSRKEVSAALKKVNISGIVFSDNNQVRLAGRGMAIDLGGNAQGYAADEAYCILKAAGIERFLMDAGGELFASGLNCEGYKWRVGVKDPLQPRQLNEVVELEDMAVSTSGSYEKFFEINGEHWSRIIDPRTGVAVKNVLAATVIAPTATDADIFSTALCVLGPVEGAVLFERLGPKYSAVVYSRDLDGNVVRTVLNSYNNFLKASKE